ncbi:hypothetical protein SAMD00023353_9000060 [Rosellinia necatrix]|uniref:Alpha-N-acetylglucosaminidase n=1 Tax=Rosellinia necatrix TaxID=77044 RepID=A0A1S8AAW1_ROSNE|nr:hypothetical protein SAMD00023353_9000060 [Rosellinia necatrix]
MALRGINTALAWIGFEKIYIEVFREMGFSDSDLEDFISGPAFLAWNHFGNIQGSWGGPTPKSWIEDQFSLQKKIVARMVELGIKPILPAFPGYTPRSITRVFPSANVSNGSNWEGFPTSYTNDTFLDPFDPLFEELQVRFISKQKSYYGDVTNFWTLDQFNENNPASGELDYLQSVSENTWKSLKAADPDAIWIMQGWLFASNSAFWTNSRVEAFLGGVPVDSDMLILDLFAESQPQWERTSSFYGKPWIWCQLHGYGGNYGLYGQIMNVTVNSIEALDASPTLVGFGLTPEGLEGNEVMYDLLLDQAWSRTPIDTRRYFRDWVTARYGAAHSGGGGGGGGGGGAGKLPQGAYDAWETLRPTVFNNTNLAANAVPKAILELAPAASGLLNRTGHHPTLLGYDPAVVAAAWRRLYAAGRAAPALFADPAFRYDLVDLTRQVLANAFTPLYERLIAAYYHAPAASTATAVDQQQQQQEQHSARAKAIRAHGERLVALLLALDGVLATNEHFRLSTWIDAARRSSSSSSSASDPAHADADADFFEYQARNQVTLWGPAGQISDYASRAWAGLVGSYYLPRWRAFVDYLAATPPAEYDQAVFAAGLLRWELEWVGGRAGGRGGGGGGGGGGGAAAVAPGELRRQQQQQQQQPEVGDLQEVLAATVEAWGEVFAA